MNIYLVDEYVEFPSSEYGGLLCVIAESREHCARIIHDNDKDGYSYSEYKRRISEVCGTADEYPLAGNHQAGIVKEFRT